MVDSHDHALQYRSLTVLKAVTPPIIADAVRAAIRRARRPRRREVPHQILPDQQLYRPHFSPWEGSPEFEGVIAAVAPHSIVSRDRMWVLYTLAQQARHLPGSFWECGVYKGGTALLLASVAASISRKQLHLFDTFTGIPAADTKHDYYATGIYSDTSLESVKQVVGHDDHTCYHVGTIPETFQALDNERIAIAHIDVVTYQSVYDCCCFIYPRLSSGGFIVFDDYGFITCPGARAAVDQFFADKPERPLVLATAQAVVIKLA